jgi:aminomethyltransferase
LASRDTLRLEAGMPLYGHELGLDVNPYEVGLGKVVRLDREEDFVGRASLEALSLITPLKVLVGLQGEGKRAARADYEVFKSDESTVSVGKITSGALSPTLGYPIAMAFVEPDFTNLGELVSVDIRGARQTFKVVPLPFYKRNK